MRHRSPHPMPEHEHNHGSNAYPMLALNMAGSFVVMYLAMFAMINGMGDYRNNLNTLYMTLTMLAPMGILMLATMRDMYKNKALNLVCYLGFALVFVLSLAGTRSQALIDDRAFISSMVPHHSGAILMCGKAKLTDAELLKLCQTISQGQREEIEKMNAIAARLK